jgi:hypothetical protein
MLEKLFDEMISGQKKKMLAIGQRIIPQLTEDDLLQPNDFLKLENHPLFRYEEGVLEGLLTARMAYLAWKREQT